MLFLLWCSFFFFFNDTATTEIYTLSLHDALPISRLSVAEERGQHRGSDVKQLHNPGDHDSGQRIYVRGGGDEHGRDGRSEEHTSELQSRLHLVCRLLLEKKKNKNNEVPIREQHLT